MNGIRLRLQQERGVALVTSLLITLIIIVLGAGLAISSRSGIKTENSFKSQQRAFEVATAGLERAREVLRQCIFSGISDPTNAPAECLSLTARLTAAAGADGLLVDSRSLAIFNASGGFSGVDDVPIVTDTALGGETYRVYVTNDPWDGETNRNDGTSANGQNVVTFTSFARGANDVGFSAVQGIYRTHLPFRVPRLPGLVTLPGPSVGIFPPSSNQSVLDGSAGDPPCFATIATSTNSATQAVIGSIPSNRYNNYRTCDPAANGTLFAHTGSIENFINESVSPNPYTGETTNVPYLTPPGDPATATLAGCAGDERDFIRYQCMESLAAAVQSQASYVGTSPTPADIGTPTNPKIAAVTGDYTLGPGTYGGMLLVRGDLTLNGNPTFYGLVLVIGNGSVRRAGGGQGQICGGFLVVDTIDNGESGDSWITSHQLVGEPYYEHDGGGTTFGGTCNSNLTDGIVEWSEPMLRLAFQQLR